MPRRSEPDPFYAVIGARLRRRRQALKLSIDTIEALTGIRKGHLSNIERGLACCRLDTMLVLAQAVEISLEALTEGIPIESCKAAKRLKLATPRRPRKPKATKKPGTAKATKKALGQGTQPGPPERTPPPEKFEARAEPAPASV